MKRCPRCVGIGTWAKDEPEERWCGVREGDDRDGKGGTEHGYF